MHQVLLPSCIYSLLIFGCIWSCRRRHLDTFSGGTQGCRCWDNVVTAFHQREVLGGGGEAMNDDIKLHPSEVEAAGGLAVHLLTQLSLDHQGNLTQIMAGPQTVIQEVVAQTKLRRPLFSTFAPPVKSVKSRILRILYRQLSLLTNVAT